MKTKKGIWFYPVLTFGLALILTNTCKKDEGNNNPSVSLTDKDGNVYTHVTIGAQIWMVENLKTTKYDDGTAIPFVTDNAAWANLTTPGYCWYENDASSYKTTYGALYNWYTVETDKLCPAGWHVATDEEWTTLANYLGGDGIAGGKLKESGTINWDSPNTGATNESGFKGLPGGNRGGDGYFNNIGYTGHWWSFPEYSFDLAWGRRLGSSYETLDRYYFNKKIGFSVRCIRE
jgi:uncharacterized protein (TIGR02145 family)